MKKLYFILINISMVFVSEGQSSLQRSTDSVAKLIQKYFNKQTIDSLYNLTATGFRRALSQKNFKEAMTGLHDQAGSLSSFSFISEKNSIAKYKASFIKGMMTMSIGLDESNKLKTFLFEGVESDDVNVQKEAVLSNNPLKNTIDKKVDSVVQPFMVHENTVGLVAGILHRGKTYTYGYGELSKGKKNIPDENTLFEIGSITKTFTATLLAHLVINNRIQLTDPINRYLPDSILSLQYNGRPITVQSLSNHSSGLPRLPGNLYATTTDISNPYKNYNDSALFSYLKNFKPFREPGGQYEYSILAVGILGVIIERASGKSYEELIREIICNPLGMQQTKIDLLSKDSAFFAQGYNAMGNANHSWEFQSLAGAGAIRSSVRDMLEYAKAQLGQKNASLKGAIALTHRQTFEFNRAKVGLGWHIFSWEGRNYLNHNGQTGGYSSTIIFDKSSGNAIVILTNSSVDPTELAITLISWLNNSAL